MSAVDLDMAYEWLSGHLAIAYHFHWPQLLSLELCQSNPILSVKLGVARVS